MPRSINPNSKVEIFLDCDKDVDPKPVFIFRPPTLADEEEIGQVFDLNDKDSKSLSKSVSDAIGVCLTGWRNMGDKVYGTDEIKTFLCGAEGFELISKLLASGRLDQDEKKSSE